MPIPKVGHPKDDDEAVAERERSRPKSQYHHEQDDGKDEDGRPDHGEKAEVGREVAGKFTWNVFFV